MIELKKIGFWRSEREPDLPLISKFVDSTWKDSEKLRVLDYLQKGKVIARYKGWSTCRICEKDNGSKDLSDGIYIWPEGYYHYVAHHNVKPTEEFLNHIINQQFKEIINNKYLDKCGCEINRK